VALTGAALALPGIAGKASAAAPSAKIDLEGGFFYYDEGDGRVQVRTLQQGLVAPLGDDFDITLNAVRDAISGASPVYNVPELSCPGGLVLQPRSTGAQTLTGASGGGASPLPPLPGGMPYAGSGCRTTRVHQVISPTAFDDLRGAVDLKVNHYHGDTVLGVGVGASRESDYTSNYLTLDLRRELDDRLTTLALGFGIADDEVSPVDEPGFGGDKTTTQAFVGVTRVLDRSSQLQVNLTRTSNRGYLTDPYKEVYVLFPNETVPEARPDERQQWNLLGRYVRYFSSLGSALHFDYRYTWDDWGIEAHTVEGSWVQKLGDGWQLTPAVRYYGQRQADFYRDYFDTLPADGHFSSDYRLATFGAMSYRLKLGKTLSDAARLDLGIEYYDRRVGYALHDTTNSDAADYRYLTLSVGWKLSF
jgi:hypothetical protein